MDRPSQELSVAAWTRSVDELLQDATTPSERAGRLADLLAQHFPAARLVSCRLEGRPSPAIAARSADRHLQGRAEAELPAWPGWADADGKEDGFPLSIDGSGRAFRGLTVAAPCREKARAFLIVALPDDVPKAKVAASRDHLSALAASLGACLGADEALRQAERLRDELRALRDMVTVGEAMVSLLHGLNNSLNTMMLQAAVVQLKVDEPVRQEIGLIRKEGAGVAARMRPLMQFREQRRQNRSVVDLHATVRAFLADAEEGQELEARLDAARPQVSAHASDLRRLLFYLVRVSIPQSSRRSDYRLRTANGDGDVQLIVEPAANNGAALSESAMPFDPYNELGNPDNLLERLALDSLLRLVGATLRLYPQADGRPTTVVSWPAAG